MKQTVIDGSSRNSDAPKRSSERAFGSVIGTVCLGVGGYLSWRGSAGALYLYGMGGLLWAAALLSPKFLKPLNWLWFQLGLLLHRIMTPVILLAMYVGIIVPTAILMRLGRKDLLQLRFDPKAESYWHRREPPGPPPDSFTHQF